MDATVNGTSDTTDCGTALKDSSRTPIFSPHDITNGVVEASYGDSDSLFGAAESTMSSVSNTAEYGDYSRGPRIINDRTRKEMKKSLKIKLILNYLIFLEGSN